MVCEDTLRIKNLPKELTDTETEDFLRHFGAIKVKVITSKAKQKSVAFAKFANKEIAKNVLLRLHQLTVLHCKLCVEYAENDIGAAQTKPNSVVNASANSGEYFQQFLKRLNSWNIYSFHQPPPAHLKYSYPSPNRATINNIAHALASVPKFYTQVVHLMNKMNLPPPFSNVPDHVFAQQMLKTSLAKTAKENSTDESEIESDGDESASKLKDVLPVKRTLGQKKNVVKRPKFIKPVAQLTSSSKETESVDNVFDRVNLQMQPKIQLKLNTEKAAETQQKQTETNVIATENESENSVENPDVITEEELKTGRMPLEDLKTLPVFKGYNPGVAGAKLYIKNVAKSADLKDLERIYKRFRRNAEGVADQFSVKLMKEGRMKGQAFVSFNGVEEAQKALEETNGFVLKEKALVVMFAKSATQKS